MEAFVYKWINIETNEYYVGVHKGSTNDGYIGSGKKFKAKYNKYPHLFKREIILECNSYDEALNVEKKLITEKTIENDKLCLNLKPGGSGGGIPGWAKKVDFKKRVEIRKKNAKRNGISYGQHRVGSKWSDEIKQKLSKIAKNRKKIQCPYCSKIGPIPQMEQWHFRNCKENLNAKAY